MPKEEYLNPIFWEETDLDSWIRINYRKLGFEYIKDSDIGCADLIGIRNGKRLVIELESALPRISSHLQWVLDKVDVIICIGGSYEGEKDISKKEIIRLVDYPELFIEVIKSRIKYIQKLEKYRKEIQKKFSEDERVV